MINSHLKLFSIFFDELTLVWIFISMMNERHLFKKLLGQSTWNKINPTIQNRLEKELFASTPVYFKGVIETVDVSLFGRFLGIIRNDIF